MFGAGAWKLRVEDKRRLGVTLNRAIRRLLGYNDYESIKDILFGFKCCLSICLLTELNCCCAVRACRAREYC